MRRVAGDVAWVRFRFGPSPGVKFPDSQFPVEAAGEFGKQGVPDIGENLSANDLNYRALSDLATKVHGAILIGHSQSGRFPFEAALLNPRSVRAAIAIEPPGCNSAGYSDTQISVLAKMPILVLFGDHLDAPQRVGVSPMNYFKDCQAFIARVNAAGGSAAMLHPVDLGIHGNSHMIMQDKNNLQIADLIIRWLRRHSL
jgi:pimeloyl-ACP methyl ester carboxylesterase